MLKLTVEERISKAKIALYKRFPFFSYLVENLNIQDGTDRLDTMGVDRYGNCYYNTKFIDTINDLELMGVLCHEVIHLAYNHPDRQNGRNIMLNGKTSLWNIAIDIVDNNVIVMNELTLPKEAIIPHNNSVTIFGISIDDIENKSAEDIYEELKTGLKEQIKKGKGQQSKDGDMTIEVSGNLGFDEHDFNKDELKEGKEGKFSKGNAENAEKDWGRVMANAYNMAKQRGNTPLGMGREFQVYNKQYINWYALLRKEIGRRIPKDYCYSRPNRKYISQDIYMPYITGETVKVLISIDTSGSVDPDTLSKFITGVVSIAKSFQDAEIRIITHDYDVHDDLLVANGNVAKIKNMKIHGGGGTTHKKLYEYLKQKRYDKQNSVLFSMTDGYSEFPERPCIPTYFILAGNYTVDMPKWSLGNVEIRN